MAPADVARINVAICLTPKPGICIAVIRVEICTKRMQGDLSANYCLKDGVNLRHLR